MLIGWVIIYILAYPVYSFFLPIYSFWSMGEFSWGNNHLVENEGGKTVMITSFHRMKLRETSISQRNILRAKVAVAKREGPWLLFRGVSTLLTNHDGVAERTGNTRPDRARIE
ncbi:Chitin synthase 6 OS=Ustilago maydis (strain 521 / FGSC 9021) GN=CHS6 PE=3 SV=2 [Rhizoctonia solani AG-1 IB]|uniref:Chitin synthase 6 n=1 Tax=Thanatephorus cucumeris (strain AG1-IB / isolate 7/3/14) TaxID=1108050 RepID=A0A0B7G464_THACB|nr:Chitin synthase 6 OS=Ustilago maydis (strain 521 / FGSC 9021) GN=CHS6 PE=3 SV=2 [Rhizoctonia solani AG-1 IB]